MAQGTAVKRDERFRVLLEGKGLRITDQRVAVLRALSWSRSPVSFTELVERLSPALDRATVYRNLVALSEAGILVRSQLGDGVWRYELPLDDDTPSHLRHPHLVCVDCGDVSCLPSGAVSVSGEAASRVTEIQLRGHCASCSH